MHQPLAKKSQMTAGRLLLSLKSAPGDKLLGLIRGTSDLENPRALADGSIFLEKGENYLEM